MTEKIKKVGGTHIKKVMNLNETIQVLLEADPNNPKSHKPKSNSYGVSKECVEFLKSKGFKQLNVYPQSFVKPSDIIFNPELATKNKDTVWVCKFPAMTPSGEKMMKIAYTRNYMKKSQIKKYKKISKISEKDIGDLDSKTLKYMSSKDKAIADAACVLRIILKTGLRVGSLNDNETGNVGVRTLSAKNVFVKGKKIRLQFIGKSYQENIAEFEDKEIASYLSSNIQGKNPEDQVFSCSYALVGKLMKKINPKKVNPKDLRTYKATEYAKMLLNQTISDPLPENPKEIKKTVKDRLKDVFEKTAAMLNNSAAMAKNSYIKPSVITDYLSQLGLEPKMVGYKHLTLESVYKVYHGTNANFKKFNLKKTAQGILWFSDSKDKILNGDAGASGRDKILHCEIKIDKPAGWEEYEKYTLWELENLGYDGIILPDDNSTDYVAFSPDQVKIIKKEINESEELPLFDNDMLPDWWDNPNVVLVKAKEKVLEAVNKEFAPLFTLNSLQSLDLVNDSLTKMVKTAEEYYNNYLSKKDERAQDKIKRDGSSKYIQGIINTLNTKTERAYKVVKIYVEYANKYNAIFNEVKNDLVSTNHKLVDEALYRLYAWDEYEGTNKPYPGTGGSSYWTLSSEYTRFAQIKRWWTADKPLIEVCQKCFKIAHDNHEMISKARKYLFKTPAQIEGFKKLSSSMRNRWGSF